MEEGVSKEWFENNCPNLFKAINENQKQYEIYGIKFRSHSDLTYYTIRDRVEDCRSFIYFRFNWRKDRDLVQVGLN